MPKHQKKTNFTVNLIILFDEACVTKTMYATDSYGKTLWVCCLNELKDNGDTKGFQNTTFSKCLKNWKSNKILFNDIFSPRKTSLLLQKPDTPFSYSLEIVQIWIHYTFQNKKNFHWTFSIKKRIDVSINPTWTHRKVMGNIMQWLFWKNFWIQTFIRCFLP